MTTRPAVVQFSFAQSRPQGPTTETQQGFRMQTQIGLPLILLPFSAWSKTNPPAPTPPKRTPAPAASAEPTATIDTTAGKMHCTLFPKQAPIGVDNFIGL